MNVNKNNNFIDKNQVDTTQNDTINENQVEITRKDTIKLSMNVDKVEIWCAGFGYSADKSFTIYLSDLEVKKVNFFNKNDVTVINSFDVRNELIGNVNKFYINKTEKIILNKQKRDYRISTDYPLIEVAGFQNNKKVFKNQTTIGDEGYDINYNSEFLTFYELLKSISN
jgi:hypothetical protein